MNLRDARKLVTDKHVKEAIRLIENHGLDWLYERTGRKEPRFRYIVIDNVRYPTKAFCFLVAQLAGETDRKTNDMTVNEAFAPLKKLEYVEVNGPPAQSTAKQEEARLQSYYWTLARPKQADFRRKLLDAYECRCAMTGCTVTEALEAAHVEPFRNGGIDLLSNGILLRSDLHRLFDAGLIAIDPSNLNVHAAPEILPDYEAINGRSISIPKGGPPPKQFKLRWSEFRKRVIN